ncbi:TfuA-like protein [Streptomyces sp. H51]|uniref:TfuA-like protein n=1 Tax=Streptomyces sp. H51 TaxID=3111770 RepID=UPI002D790043|nr:TfuA-like protein [Streptomyces sp. H51]
MKAATVTVFAGPSLRPADLAELRRLAGERDRTLDLRPPVRRHDLAALIGAEPRRIVMLDGEFGQSLAVSVTEVRALLFAGQPLTGASSMGALRAVECRTIGMTGSGWVYERYLNGSIESDGEVALLYDPEDYTPITVPLVNVRWLLARRVGDGRLSPAQAHTALEIARSLNFRARRHSVLLKRWKLGLPADAVADLEEHFAADHLDRWDRKRLDALEAVRAALSS